MFWKAHSVIVLALALYAQGHATSEQKLKQEFVPHHGHHGELDHIGSHTPEHHVEYAWAYPSYEFSYKVNDPHTHDYKGQHETRHGDEVRGEYWLLQPDGKIRTVKYHANKHKGFRAHVHYSKHHGHIEHPHIEEPRLEEPRSEEPHLEKPREEGYRVEEPNVEEPRVEEPHVEEPRVEEPREEVHREEERQEEEPREQEPHVAEPRVEEPGVEEIIKPVIEIVNEEPPRSAEQGEPEVNEAAHEDAVKAEERNDRRPETRHHKLHKPVHIEYYINHKYRKHHEEPTRREREWRRSEETAVTSGLEARIQEEGEPRREVKHHKPVHIEHYSKIHHPIHKGHQGHEIPKSIYVHHEIHGHREEIENRRSERVREEQRGREEQRVREEERGRVEQRGREEERGRVEQPGREEERGRVEQRSRVEERGRMEQRSREEERGRVEQRGREEERGSEKQSGRAEQRGREEERVREEQRGRNEVHGWKDHHSHKKHEQVELLPILLRPFSIERHHELTEKHRKPEERRPIRIEGRSDRHHEPRVQLQRMHKPIILPEHTHRHQHRRD